MLAGAGRARRIAPVTLLQHHPRIFQAVAGVARGRTTKTAVRLRAASSPPCALRPSPEAELPAAGKPTDDDLRTRKITYLFAAGHELANTRHAQEVHDVLAPAAWRPAAETMDRMRAALERVGARTLVGFKIAQLAAASVRHFDRTGAEPVVRREFATLVERASGILLKHAGEAA